MAKPEYYAASSQGSAGPDTALIQTWLNGSRDPCTHFDPVTVDGRFGSDTAKAVQEFQLRNNLKADGTGIYQEVFDTIDYDGVSGAEVVDILLDGMESVGYTINA